MFSFDIMFKLWNSSHFMDYSPCVLLLKLSIRAYKHLKQNINFLIDWPRNETDMFYKQNHE